MQANFVYISLKVNLDGFPDKLLLDARDFFKLSWKSIESYFEQTYFGFDMRLLYIFLKIRPHDFFERASFACMQTFYISLKVHSDGFQDKFLSDPREFFKFFWTSSSCSHTYSWNFLEHHFNAFLDNFVLDYL